MSYHRSLGQFSFSPTLTSPTVSPVVQSPTVTAVVPKISMTTYPVAPAPSATPSIAGHTLDTSVAQQIWKTATAVRPGQPGRAVADAIAKMMPQITYTPTKQELAAIATGMSLNQNPTVSQAISAITKLPLSVQQELLRAVSSLSPVLVWRPPASGASTPTKTGASTPTKTMTATVSPMLPANVAPVPMPTGPAPTTTTPPKYEPTPPPPPMPSAPPPDPDDTLPPDDMLFDPAMIPGGPQESMLPDASTFPGVQLPIDPATLIDGQPVTATATASVSGPKWIIIGGVAVVAIAGAWFMFGRKSVTPNRRRSRRRRRSR